MIVVIDYDMGNVGSVLKMLKKVGGEAVLSSDPEAIRAADKLVLPGVGAFDTGMRHLRNMGLMEPLNEKVLRCATPVLGICLGMQLLTRRSEEGSLPGLGWINADTVRFRHDTRQTGLRVPHMGWNTVTVVNDSPLFEGLKDDEETAFYFVHSYYVACEDPLDVITTTHYGHDFTSAVQRGNIMGTQFHPEKSHKFGMRLLRNFVEKL